ncbi:MAG: hypothetical protein BWY49_00146 [Candidatus Omnitrophica bacterium ADurb.Bin314]|nr:MAG: hypothetical protein BWY49_00146 [Candidatus Omnitrophica bacterium ADurb.Bin314]
MHSFIKILGLVCAFGLVLFLGIEDLLDIEELDKAIKLPIVAVLMLVILYCLKKESRKTRSGKNR